MPVTDITYQPLQAQLLAAYRPVRFIVTAAGNLNGAAIPPYVSCDIYIETVYYKSMIRTAPVSFTESDSNWEFDIADALQEYMQANIAAIDNQNVLLAPNMSAKVYCRFRASGIDNNGFTVDEETAPIQGTRFTDPVEGTGLVSNTFFVINATLQHEENQNLASHLNAYKQGGWNEDAYPLSHRKKYFFCPGDSDHFPVIYKGACLEADLKIHYRYKGELATQTATAIDINTCDAITYTLEATDNHVIITLDEEVPAGHYVLVRYKKIGTLGAEWVEVGKFNTQTISFYVQPSPLFILIGDYDLQVIHFCSSCISATPEADTFEVTGIASLLGWRGINPFCVTQVFPGPVYVVLELRNVITEEDYLPSDLVRNTKRTVTTANLYAKFFSDPAHLSPVVVSQDELKVLVKKKEVTALSPSGIDKTVETVEIFNQDAAAFEVLMAENIKTFEKIETYGPYPTIVSTSTVNYTFEMFPDHVLQEGNTGFQGYATLQQYNIDTNAATGTTKDNVEEDTDYIEPEFDLESCPAGPDNTKVLYGAKLEVAKVEFRQGFQFFYADTVPDTEAGGYQFIESVPSNRTTFLTVKAKTLDTANTTGNIVVRVTSLLGGVQTLRMFVVPDNIETRLPAIFRSITEVNISNF